MKVAFHLYFMTLRGTEIATYDFAHHNETLLGGESVIVYSDLRGKPDPRALEKFSKRFPVYRYEDDVFDPKGNANLAHLLESLSVEALYNHEVYYDAQWSCPSCANWNHATFPWCQPRKGQLAYTSEWLARPTGGQVIPLMIDLPHHDENLRAALNIPANATVIGRYGGDVTFDLDFVHQAIPQALSKRNDLYFAFMHTRPFCDPHPRILHLDGTSNSHRKVAFINTCDAFLHARKQGETFGLAVGEFSSRNKPVLTWAHSDFKAHLEHLGHKALVYENQHDLTHLLNHFTPQPDGDWDAFSEHFSPEAVMQTFKHVFLDAR